MIVIVNGRYAHVTRTIYPEDYTLDGGTLTVRALGETSVSVLNKEVAVHFEKLLKQDLGIELKVVFENQIEQYARAGKSIEEKARQAEELQAKRIEEATGIETRATILGHMQRGGSPTCKDRVYATTMGAMAVDLLCEGKTNRVIAHKNGEFVDFDIDEALAMQKSIDEYMYQISKTLV